MKKTLFFALILTAFCGLSAFDVVRGGKAAATLSIRGKAGKELSDAVGHFLDDIENMTGARLELNGTLPNKIELVPVPASLRNEDTVEVSFPEKGLMRLSGGARGLVRALPLLLERFAGVRYVYPTADGTHYPASKDFLIPEKGFTHKPFFNLTRALTNQYAPYIDTLGAKWRPNCQHDIPHYVIPVAKYMKSGVWPAPDVFPLLKGKRLDMRNEAKRFMPGFQSDWQPCYSNPAAVDEAVKNILETLGREPGRTFISLSPNDNNGYCECAECAKMNGRSGVPFRMYERYRDRSNSYFHWCSRIAEKVSEKYPDVLFSTLAYREVHFAPDFKLHPNIVVFLCFDFGCSQYPEVLEKQKKWIAGWRGNGASLGIWEYGFGDSAYTLPRVGFRTQGKMFRLLADNGFRAFFSEGAESLGDGPKRYLYMKLMEDPYADVEALLADWYAACVGAEAAPFLAGYFDFWDKYWPERASKTAFAESRTAIYHTFVPFGPYMYGLEKGDMARLRVLMEKMRAAAERSGDARQKIRARWLMTAFEYFEASAAACASEILPPSAAVETPEAALAVLKYFPAARAADARRRAIMEKCLADPGLKWWAGLKKVVPRSENIRMFDTLLSKTAGFASDPFVRHELKEIVRDKANPKLTRMIANSILKSGKEKNILSELPEFARLAKGRHTLALPLKNGEWLHNVPVAPGRYIVRVRIGIPKDAVLTGGAWCNLRVQGRSEFKKPAGNFSDTPKLRPEAGKSYTIINTIDIPERAKYLQFIVNVFNFRHGDTVTVSDIAVIPLGKSGGGQEGK